MTTTLADGLAIGIAVGIFAFELWPVAPLTEAERQALTTKGVVIVGPWQLTPASATGLIISDGLSYELFGWIRSARLRKSGWRFYEPVTPELLKLQANSVGVAVGDAANDAAIVRLKATMAKTIHENRLVATRLKEDRARRDQLEAEHKAGHHDASLHTHLKQVRAEIKKRKAELKHGEGVVRYIRADLAKRGVS